MISSYFRSLTNFREYRVGISCDAFPGCVQIRYIRRRPKDQNTECPTRYRTRHFFNNSNTNEDIATKFEEEYVRCVRNEEECVCSVCLFRCNIFIGVRIIKEMLGSVASGTTCILEVIM